MIHSKFSLIKNWGGDTGGVRTAEEKTERKKTVAKIPSGEKLLGQKTGGESTNCWLNDDPSFR